MLKKIFLSIGLSTPLLMTQAQQHFYPNPILAGFYPDPSICRVGGDYYLVNSSFAYFPGLPVFHSKDLINWEQIGNAMDRNTQLNLSDARVSTGLYAPTIRWHDGLFYIICTNVTLGGNFIITAKNPAGEWSDPAYLPDVNGIDPSLFFDDDGKSYITYNSEPPGNKSLYNGHRTIRIIEYDVRHNKTTGDNKIIVNGGTDITKHPIWIEGPHLYKINGWYYLMCAEGGTADQHSEVIFRSKTPDGGFVPYENNPILTQRDLDTARKNAVTSTGHADLVETPEGKWYAVFLGCRPYKNEYYNTGRETFMAPVSWENDFPVINPKGKAIQYYYPTPNNDSIVPKLNAAFSGNYIFKDSFTNTALNNRYLFLRNIREKWYKTGGGYLTMQLRPETCSGLGNPSFIGFRQAHLKNYARVKLNFRAQNAQQQAGLLVFYNETHYYFLCKSMRDGKPAVQLFQSSTVQGEQPKELAFDYLNGAAESSDIVLLVQCSGDNYSFRYSFYSGRNMSTHHDDGSLTSEEVWDWADLKGNVDATFLSTQTAGGFTGCVYAMYATSNGTASDNHATFNSFEYGGDDDVYRKKFK